MMYKLTLEGKNVSVFPGSCGNAPVVYLNTFGEEGQQVFSQLQKYQLPPFSLVTVSGLDWNRDMVPWDAPPVFKNGEPFTGGADAYLQQLSRTIVPEAERHLPGTPCWRGLAGYSLAGLFTLYALYGTSLFSRFACMSGSFWFPGIQDYLFAHRPCCRPDCLYFSLGDKESKTRNPVLRTVLENTRSIQAYYEGQDIPSLLVMQPGNHYNHTAERTAAGIAWLLLQ